MWPVPGQQEQKTQLPHENKDEKEEKQGASGQMKEGEDLTSLPSSHKQNTQITMKLSLLSQR